MTVTAKQDRIAPVHVSWPRGWRLTTALITLAAGSAVITGTLLPWVEAFAGLIPIPGVRGGNGKLLAVAGVAIAAAGLAQLVTGGHAARWLGGLTGFAASAFSGYLLIRLTSSMHALGGDSMAAVRGGPGLVVTTAASLAAFATLLLPPSPQAAVRRQRDAAGAGAGNTGAATPLMARLATPAALRRGLQIALGVIWLLDAALQYQPVMFSKTFATMMLAPAGAGLPFFVSGPVHLTAGIVAASPAAWNAAFATVQLALGAGLLFRRTARAALAGTIAWALAVWWLGEGLGGILSSATSSPLAGAPGAAFLYALLALLIWPPAPSTRADGEITDRAHASVAVSGPLGRYARLAWFVTWAVMAALMAHAPFRAAALTAAGGTPAAVITAAFTAAFGFAAAGVLFRATTRAALITAAIAAALLWSAGEHYGAIFSGMATDPNSGPLLVLLALAFWPVRRVSPAPVRDDGFPTG
jgi:hypothetical protein